MEIAPRLVGFKELLVTDFPIIIYVSTHSQD